MNYDIVYLGRYEVGTLAAEAHIRARFVPRTHIFSLLLPVLTSRPGFPNLSKISED